MNFNHDTGTIDTMLIIDTTIAPPLGGTTNSLQVLGTGSIFLPFGTTAQQPANSTGQIRYNTDTGSTEFNNGSAWVANGGSVSSITVTGSTGLAVGGSPITTSGTITLTLSTSLQNTSTLIAGGTTGLIAHTGAGTVTDRTITGTASNISVTNGDGVSGNPTIDLINAGTPVTAQFVKITTDAKGRVTATTPVVAGDITTLVDATYVNVAGDSMTSAANLTFSGGGEVLGLPASPSGATAATSKAYVDALVQGLDPKNSVRAATTAAGTLATSFENGDTIDGVTLATGDRILIKNQAAPAENGIYTVNASGAPTRAIDMDTWLEVPGAFTWVEEGTTNADTGWVCTSNQGGTLNTTAITFSQFGGVGSYTAGTGLTLTGNQFSLTTPVAVTNGGTGTSSAPTNGQLLIGNGSTYTLATLTQGAGITITNGSGSITVANAGVTSIAGTANQITASASTGAVTLSTPTTFIAPGTIASTTTITAGSNFIASTATASYTSTATTALQVIPGAAATTTSAGNTLTLQGGPGGTTSGAGGNVVVQAGTPTAGAGGNASLTASAGVGTNQNGGNAVITAGAPTGSGTAGVINLVIPAAGALQINGAAGTSGQILTSNGPTTAPTWQNATSTVALNGITAAGGSNSINNGDNAQTWNWALTTAAKSAFTFTENTASTNGAGSQFILDVGTIAGSTASPLRVRALGQNVLSITAAGAPTLQGIDTGTGQTATLRGGSSSTAATAGGAVTVLGGTAGTSGTGGAAAVTGGVGGTTGVGGAVNITGGAGGTTSGNAGGVNITGGTPVSGAGGSLSLTGSNGVGTNQNGGGITVTGGNPTGTGTPGSISLTAGALQGAGTPATVSITGGAGNGATTGGAVSVTGGSGGTTGAGAVVTLRGGPGGSTSGNGGAITVAGGIPVSGAGGAVNITANAGVGTNQNGGNVVITAGDRTGSGTAGVINLVIPATGALQVNGAAGTAGQALLSNGATTAPTWQSVQSGLSLYRENPSTPTTPSATGTNAVAIGTGSTAAGTDSLAVGNGTSTTLYGAKTFGNGTFATAGDAQKMFTILRGITTNATITEIFLDGAAATQRLVLPNNSLWTFSVFIAGRRTDATGGGAGYRVDGVIRRDASAATTTLTGAVSKSILGETNAAWNVTVDADTTNGSLRIRVTGEAAKTIRWVASAEITQVTN